VLARAAQAQLANARNSLALQDDNLQIAQWRVQAGLVSTIDRNRPRAQRAQTAASIPSIEASYNGFVSRLGVLTGQAPGALKSELEAVKPIPRGPAQVAAGIPAETLRQRPDVRRRRTQPRLGTAQIGVATAQLYPVAFDRRQHRCGQQRAQLDLRRDHRPAVRAISPRRSSTRAGRAARYAPAQAAADGAFLVQADRADGAGGHREFDRRAAGGAARETEFRIALEAANNQAILARMQYRSGLTDFTTLNQAESRCSRRATAWWARNPINRRR
jgi:multidrug efflux system outer membrane protein